MDFCSEQSWLASAKRLTCRSPAVKTCPEWRREMAWGCWIRPLKSHSPRMHFLPGPFVSPCTLRWSVAKTNPNIRLVFVESLLASHVFLVFGCNLLWSQVVVRASSTESQAMPRFTPLAWFGKPCSQDQTFAILLLQDNCPSKLSLKSVMIYIAASQPREVRQLLYQLSLGGFKDLYYLHLFGEDFHFGSYFWNPSNIGRTFVTRAFQTFLMMPMRHARFHHPTTSKQVNLRRVGQGFIIRELPWIAKTFALKKWRFCVLRGFVTGFHSMACFDSEIAVEVALCDLFVILLLVSKERICFTLNLSFFTSQLILEFPKRPSLGPFFCFWPWIRASRRTTIHSSSTRENVGSDWLRVVLRIHNARAADGSLGSQEWRLGWWDPMEYIGIYWWKTSDSWPCVCCGILLILSRIFLQIT